MKHKKKDRLDREGDRGIRLWIYEETKHMTHEELSEYLSEERRRNRKKYGFKTVSSVDDA